MKIIYFSDGQSGKDWLDWRRNGIGASDIGVITGSSPYKTLLTMWDEKCGFKGSDPINPAMAHGIKNEAVARDWINENQKLDLNPLCLEDNKYSFFRASLDGYDKEKKVLAEIKCPVSEKVLNDAVENQKLPLYWLHQVQWQIMLCKPTRAFVAIWDHRSETCTTIECFADIKLQEEMREKAIKFWEGVRMGIPPKPGPKDYVHVDNPELKKLLLEYQNLTKVIQEADTQKKERRSQIIKYGAGGNFKCSGFFISRCANRAGHDVNKMKEDGIDIDKYIKKNSNSGHYRISCPLVRKKYMN